jgi:O-antigen ligase
MSGFGNRSELVARQFFLMAIFCVSFSTALTNLFVAGTYISFLVALSGNRKLLGTAKLLPSFLGLLFFSLFLLGATWSIAPHNEILNAIGKYSKLLLIPLGIALAWGDKTLARRALVSFIAGAAVLAFSSYLVRFNVMPFSGLNWWKVGDATNAYVFKNHITFGILVGFAAVFCLNYSFYASSMRIRLLALGLGIFFVIPPVFLTQGRSGYIAIFIGLITLSFLRFRSNWKMLIVSIVTVITVFVGFYSVSDTFKLRTSHLIFEFKEYFRSEQKHSSTAHFSNSAEDNSSGVRLSYYREGLRLIASHPLLGLGTGSFSEGFAPAAKRLWSKDDPEYSARHQPHSDIILIGVQLGVVGWIVYFSLMASLVWSARKDKSCEADSLLLLAAIFILTSVFNSLLWDVTEGYWFALLSGCLYGHIRRSIADASGQ